MAKMMMILMKTLAMMKMRTMTIIQHKILKFSGLTSEVSVTAKSTSSVVVFLSSSVASSSSLASSSSSDFSVVSSAGSTLISVKIYGRLPHVPIIQTTQMAMENPKF